MSVMKESDILQQALNSHQQGDFYLAISLYQQVILEKNDPLVSNNLASAQLAIADNQGAAKTLKLAINNFSENSELLMTLAIYHSRLGEYDKAIDSAKMAIVKEPDNALFHYNLANFYYQNERFTDAKQSYKKTLLLDDSFAEAHFNLGTLYYQQGLMNKAATYLENAVKIAPQFIQAILYLGQVYSEQSKYVQAVETYQRVLALEPNSLAALKAIGMVLHISGELDSGLAYYQKSLEIAPDDEEAIVLMANCLRDMNDLSGAEKLYRQVLSLNPENTTAKQNLNQLSKAKIASWHFTMLADESRNMAFDTVLNSQIKANDLVLDIGTGSGLLALMARRAGASHVIACEMQPDLALVAKQVIADNDMSDAIQICNIKSTSMIVGDELPRKADVLVAEILDSGLLGEGVIPTFRHATANLLKKNAVIIPKSATIEACLIQCDDLKRVNPVNTISGFDLSAFNTFRESRGYISSILNATPHQVLSETTFVQYFDFSNLPPFASAEKPNRTDLTMQVIQSGELQGIAFWFQLHLDDEITLSSGPGGEMVHWGQAIHFFDHPRPVIKGELVHVQALQSEVLLTFQLL